MSDSYESRNLMNPKNENKQLKYTHSQQTLSNAVDRDENSSQNYQSNKLPLNLFLTPTQYNKLLITNGKNRAKQVSRISEGYLSNLQFVNDNIFEKMLQQREIARMNIKHEIKRQKKCNNNNECTCCCCQQFCQQCSIKKHQQQCNKFSSIQMQKTMSEIDQQIAHAREGKKKKNLFSDSKYSRSKHNYSRRVNSALSSAKKIERNNFIKNKEIAHHTSQQNAVRDISYLVMKSLIDFSAVKKKQAFLKRQQEQAQRDKHEYLKNLDAQIRSNNLIQLRQQHAMREEVKSESKTKISKDYWDRVKGEVSVNMKSDNYSAVLKEQLRNYKLNVYAHVEVPKKKVALSKQQIERLRVKHEVEAKKQIQLERKDKLNKKQRIQANLKSLQKQRILHIKAAPHKPFKPTQEMINSAFKNIVQPNLIDEGNNMEETRKPNKRVSKKRGK